MILSSCAWQSRRRHREDRLLEESGVGDWQGVCGRGKVEEIEGADKRGWSDSPWGLGSVGKEMKPEGADALA